MPHPFTPPPMMSKSEIIKRPLRPIPLSATLRAILRSCQYRAKAKANTKNIAHAQRSCVSHMQQSLRRPPSKT
ncbi:MAG: hypothetical protein ACI95R_002551 [Halioglobus sp.]|jgi:hypothetical protein